MAFECMNCGKYYKTKPTFTSSCPECKAALKWVEEDKSREVFAYCSICGKDLSGKSSKCNKHPNAEVRRLSA